MFYKIDPRQAQLSFDLAADGFLEGDQLWVKLRGDFQPTPEGGGASDTFKNTDFEIGSKAFDADKPAEVKARETTLVALNLDRPLGDNSDPDGDYGVEVRLLPFTDGNDTFRFEERGDLPRVQGSLYEAGAGNDKVVMPDAPLDWFDTDKRFKAGSGDDRIVAGDLDLDVNLGSGTDTFVLKDAEIDWGRKENRDRDGTLVLEAGDARHKVRNAEVLKDGKDKSPLVKWYVDIDRGRDGDMKIKFFENGKKIVTADGFYDEALPPPEGKFQGSFRKDGKDSVRIKIEDVDAFENRVDIKAGSNGGKSELDFMTSKKNFLKVVYDRIEKAYEAAGSSIPWDGKKLDPLVPLTIEIDDKIDQPVLKGRNVTTDDRSNNNVVEPRFKLSKTGKEKGFEYKSVQIFFKAEGDAVRGEDWDFAEGTRKYRGNDFKDGVLRQGRDADGNKIYSVMIERGERAVKVPIEVFRERASEGTERVRLEIVDIDLWKHKGSGPELYGLSGGPNKDKERDFDGPTGLENLLVADDDAVVKIVDDLMS